jgi:hypothetical protein
LRHVFVDLRSDSFYFIVETHSLPNAHSLLPSQLYLDRSHCPRPHASYLAALPSTRAIPDVTQGMLDRTTLNPEEAKSWGLVHEIKAELFAIGAEVISIHHQEQK